MQSKEHKIGELLANSVEDHFFNPAALGRYLADQPIYTIDRVMEVVAWIIEKQAERYRREVANNGTISEGLIIANMLDKVIDKIKVSNDLKSVQLPITPKERGEFIKSLPETKETNYRYSWLHETNNTNRVTIDHPFI
jgi:P2-related tail formation protein